MDTQDWSNFTKRISINSDAKTLFESWTTQENIERWFLSKAEFRGQNNEVKDKSSKIKKGDKYLWMWHGSEFIEEGEILENNNKNILKFTFSGCIVSISIKKDNDENVVELIQSDIPLDEASKMNNYVGCSGGWTFYLTNLKSILEGGLDLRNRNKGLVDVINT